MFALGKADYLLMRAPRILDGFTHPKGIPMTICPIAIVAGCPKCPIFKVCPLKGAIGSKPPPPPPVVKLKGTAKPRAAAGKKK